MLKSAFVFTLSVRAFTPALLAAAPALAPVMEGDEAKALCPVTGKTIPAGKGVKVMVRGQEYTVIDKAAADQLAANPDMFLNPDGTPKNAGKKEPKPY